jgi:predicted SAM-dependent methyltransferase
MKLDVGSGKSPIEGCVTVDLFSAADISAPMWDIPLQSGTVDELHCRYSMEHIPRAKVLPTLTEWKRLLKSDGEIIVTVPDFLWCCKVFIASPDTGRSMDYIFGGQSSAGDFHKIGYTEKIMIDYCAQAGLVVVRVERNQDHYFENMVFHIRKSGEQVMPTQTEAEKIVAARKEWKK